MAKSVFYIEGTAAIPSKRFNKRKTLLIVLIIFTVIGGTADYIMSKFNVSVSGKVINPSLSQQKAGLSFDSTPVPVNGAYVSFTYPQAMSVYTGAQKASFPILESYEYKYSDILTWLLVVAVIQLPENNLNSDSSYTTRVQNPEQYQPSTVTVNHKIFTVMTDTTASGFSELAFSLNNSKVCDISLLGNDNLGTANLQKVFDMVLGSLSWH